MARTQALRQLRPGEREANYGASRWARGKRRGDREGLLIKATRQQIPANRSLTGPRKIRRDPTLAVLPLAYTKLAFNITAEPLIKGLLPCRGFRLCRILSETA